MYPVTTHCTEAIGLARSTDSVSRATLTIVVSRIDMIAPATTTAASGHTCLPIAGGAGPEHESYGTEQFVT